jgi:hypothetical protein
MVRRRLEWALHRENEKQAAQEPNQVSDGIRLRSYSTFATISASSASM